MTGGRESNDRSTASTSPSGSRLQSHTTSIARSRSRSSSKDGTNSGGISGSESREYTDEDAEVVVDIGFPTSRTFATLGPVLGHSGKSSFDDGKTPTKETINPFGFSFPTNGQSQDHRDLESMDTAIALTPPTPTTAGRYTGSARSGARSHEDHDLPKTKNNISSTTISTSPTTTVRAAFHAVPVDEEEDQSPFQSPAEVKMATRLENRKSEFYASAEGAAQEDQNMRPSSNIAPITTGQNRRSSYKLGMPIPRISTRDLATAASLSASHTNVITDPSRFPLPPPNEGDTAQAVRRKSSTRSRLRRRASTLGMAAPTRGHRSEPEPAGTADALDATASSSGEALSEDPTRRGTLGRRSSRSRRDVTRLETHGGPPRPEHREPHEHGSNPTVMDTKSTQNTVTSKTSGDADQERDEWRQRRKASNARDAHEKPSLGNSGRASPPRKDGSTLPRHSKRHALRDKEPGSPSSARAPVEMSLPNAKVVRAPKSGEYWSLGSLSELRA